MILPVLIEAALRSIVLAAAVFLALRLFKVTSAETQVLAWRLVLIASLVMPLLMQFKVALPLLPAPQMAMTAPAQEPALLPAAGAVHAALPVTLPATVPNTASIVSPSLLVSIYVLVVAAFVLRFLLGVTLTLRLAATSHRIRENWTNGYHVRAGARVPTPLTFGNLILLPLEHAEWPEEKRRAVIAHEGAHVRNGDSYVHIFATLNRAIFWFSPLGWWLPKKLSELAETISDDAALARVSDRPGYARILLDVSTQAQGSHMGIAMAKPSTISRRVARVISETVLPPRLSMRRKALLTVSLVPLLALSAVTGLKAQAPNVPQPQRPAARPATDGSYGITVTPDTKNTTAVDMTLTADHVQNGTDFSGRAEMKHGPNHIQADRIQLVKVNGQPARVEADGNVVVVMDDHIVRATHATYDLQTGMFRIGIGPIAPSSSQTTEVVKNVPLHLPPPVPNMHGFTVKADVLTPRDDIIAAKGHVVLEREDARIQADSMILHVVTEVGGSTRVDNAQATGNVVLTRGSKVTRRDETVIDLRGGGFIPPN